MAQTHLEVFQSEYHMLKFFGKYLPKLDVDASARLAPFLYSYDNELVMGKNLYEFLNQIEAMTALGINTVASTKKGHAYLVFFDETPKDPAKFVESVAEIAAARANILHVEPKEDVGSALASLVKTTVSEPVVEVKEEVKEVPVVEASTRSDEEKAEIMAKAEALRDDSKKAAAKAALESFALEISVSLSKAKTFDAMLEDLKAAL